MEENKHTSTLQSLLASPEKMLYRFEQLSQGVNVKERVIYLDEDISLQAASYIKERAYLIAELSEDSTSPITLQISSYGGDAYGALAVIDTLILLPMPINTLVVGTAQSAGSIIAALATGKRQITANSYLMIHMLQVNYQGSINESQRDNEHFAGLNERVFNILAKQSNKPASFWKSKSQFNLYLSAEQALEYGLVDEVVAWEGQKRQIVDLKTLKSLRKKKDEVPQNPEAPSLKQKKKVQAKKNNT